MTTSDSTTTPARAPGTVPALVRCSDCHFCMLHAARLVRIQCRFPRERDPHVVDLTNGSGWTLQRAAEVCPHFTPNQVLSK